MSKLGASLSQILAALALALSAAAAPPLSTAQQAKLEAKDAKPAPTEKNAAQIELLETKYRFESNGDSRKEVHTRVRINNELGARQFARLNFDFNRSFQSVEIPFVRVTHASGGTADTLPSAITDNPNPAVVDYPAYHDVRVKSVRILGLQPDDLLEYRVVTTTTHHPLAPDFWLDHTFDRSGVVSHEIFELDLPGHPEPVTSRYRKNETPPAELYTGVPSSSADHIGSGNDERSLFRWDLKNTLSQSESDPERSQPADIVATTFSAWGSLAERLKSQLPKWQDDEWTAVISRIASATTPTSTPEDKLRSAYDTLSRGVRTIDLPLEAQAFKTRSPQEVLESGYGTSLEKCNVLAQIANRLGFKAEAALNGTPGLEDEFARPTVFTHSFVVALLNQQFVTLDPSLEVAPFGLLAAKFRSQPLMSLAPFVLGDTVGVWITPPPVLPFNAHQNVKVTAAIAASGALSAKVKYILRGDNELLLRVAFHKTEKEKWKDVAQMLALSDGFRGQIVNVTASDPYATREPFTVEYEISQAKFIDWSKKTVQIPAILPLPGLPEPPTAAQLTSNKPIELGTPLAIDLEATIELPAGATAQAPIGTTVNRDYATFTSKYSVQGNTLHASRSLHFISSELPASRATDFNAFLHAVQSDQTQLFTIQPAPQK